MNHRVETLLRQAHHLLRQLKQSDDKDLSAAETEASAPREELRRVALTLVQINTNSFSRTNRERINSTVVASALFILGSEGIGILQQIERLQAKLKQDLSGVFSRAARREPMKKLRWLDEQRILFLRRELNDPQEHYVGLKRKRETYFSAKRALGIDTKESACDSTDE